jgi:hypothetical protein
LLARAGWNRVFQLRGNLLPLSGYRPFGRGRFSGWALQLLI